MGVVKTVLRWDWLAAVMALHVRLRAQTTTATLRGVSRDQKGAALPGGP